MSREEIKKAAGVDTIRRTRMLPKQEQLTLGQFLNLLSGETEKTSRAVSASPWCS